MLVLTRKVKEQIRIGENVVVTIVQVRGKTVRVGIEAPKNVRVVRAEIGDQPAKVERPAAVKAGPVRYETVEADPVEAPGGFSSPFMGCVSLTGESAGLYPFVRRRTELKSLTTSSLVAARR
jgi:carbon storage regulator CsrA